MNGGRHPRHAGASAGLVHQEPSRYGTRCTTPATSTRWTCSPRSAWRSRPKHHGGHVLGSAAPAARRRHRRVPVRLLPDHVRRRPPAPDPRLRRHLHPQPGRGRGRAQRGLEPTSWGGDLRIRTDLTVPVFMFETQTDLIDTGLRPGAAAQHPPDPDLGGGGHLARRRLSRRAHAAIWAVPRPSTTGRSMKWSRPPSPPSPSGSTTGRRRRGRHRSSWRHQSRRAGPRTCTATSSVACGRRPSTSRSRR